jgi:hypothetical protein
VQLVFFLRLLLYTCVQTFDVMGGGKIFWELNKALVHRLGTCMYCTWNLLKIFVLLFILFITNSNIEQYLLFFSVRLICEGSTLSVSE